MSTKFRSLSRTTVTRSSRYLYASSPHFSRFSSHQWQPSALLSTTHQKQYPHDRLERSPRWKMIGWFIAGVAFSSIFHSLRSSADHLQDKHELRGLATAVVVQYHILNFPVILDDPRELLRIVKAAYVLCLVGVTSFDNDAYNSFFEEMEAYIGRHAEEMKQMKLEFKDGNLIIRDSRRNQSESHSDPLKVKLLLGTFCYKIWVLMCPQSKDLYARQLEQNLTKVMVATEKLIEEVTDIIHGKKGPPEIGSGDDTEVVIHQEL